MKRPQDRQSKIASQPGTVKMAMIRMESNHVTCSCGWLKAHLRQKVLDEAAQRHVNAKHFGQALWM